MKTITLLSSLMVLAFAANSQQVPAIKSNATSFEIRSYNPSTQSSTLLNTHNGTVRENTLAFDNQTNKIFVLNKANHSTKLESYSALNGKLIHSINLNGKILGGVYIPSSKSYGLFSINTKFNGYGNNQEDISFIAIDVHTGRELYKTDMSSISFEAEVLPFYANDVKSGNSNVAKSVAISSLAYIPNLNQVVFTATDVVGVNRMFRIDAATGRVISKQAIYHNILDLAYNHVKDELKAVAFEKMQDKIKIYALTLNMEDLKGENRKDMIDIFTNPQTYVVSGTSIEFDLDHTYYITHPSNAGQNTPKSYLFKLDADAGEVETSVDYNAGNPQFKFGYEKKAFEQITFLNSTKIFPNPTQGAVSITSLSLPIQGVKVMDANGKILMNIQVEALVNEVNFNISELPTGVYFVSIENQGPSVVKRLVVQH